MELGTENVEQSNKKIRPTMAPSITTLTNPLPYKILKSIQQRMTKTELIPIQCDQFISYMNIVRSLSAQDKQSDIVQYKSKSHWIPKILTNRSIHHCNDQLSFEFHSPLLTKSLTWSLDNAILQNLQSRKNDTDRETRKNAFFIKFEYNLFL